MSLTGRRHSEVETTVREMICDTMTTLPNVSPAERYPKRLCSCRQVIPVSNRYHHVQLSAVWQMHHVRHSGRSVAIKVLKLVLMRSDDHQVGTEMELSSARMKLADGSAIHICDSDRSM